VTGIHSWRVRWIGAIGWRADPDRRSRQTKRAEQARAWECLEVLVLRIKRVPQRWSRLRVLPPPSAFRSALPLPAYSHCRHRARPASFGRSDFRGERMRIPPASLVWPLSQQHLNQTPNAILVPGKRRRPSPRGDWAGSTFVKMVGDTGLELASGAQVGPDSPVLLGLGALRSAQLRSNCYQNCYQGQGQAATVE
jgi:hypothetical protein